jgi:hypothetical protein
MGLMRMQIDDNTCHALVVFRGNLELVAVQKTDGDVVSFTTQHKDTPVTLTSYDDQLDIYFNPTEDDLSPVHIALVAETPELLPSLQMYLVPNKKEIDRALPIVLQHIDVSDLPPTEKNYLNRLFSASNAITLACPFMGIAPDSFGALEEAAFTAIDCQATAADLRGPAVQGGHNP